MSDSAFGFLQHFLQAAAEQGRSIVGRALGSGQSAPRFDRTPLAELARLLLTARGEASGVVIAREIMTRYETLADDAKLAFLLELSRNFAADPARIRAAFARYDAKPEDDAHQHLLEAVEPPRQDVLRRLNLAPGNTASLVRMRADLLRYLPKNPDLHALDRDFVHLFASWFNRGFLMLRRIDWSSPAHILEKIIRYEAVHAIASWDDLRRRIEPPDRRCFAFFHPALVDEPLIFVEVALMTSIPAAIEPILTDYHPALAPESANVAVFYSISNCQQGLARISFGNFLIKQVVEELKRDLPSLATFVTLSPVPGFRAWVERELAAPQSPFLQPEDRQILGTLNDAERQPDALAKAKSTLEPLLASYFLQARTGSGKLIDPVGRFHLGNGARLDRLNCFGDFSAKGWQDSFGAMVNYRYDLAFVEDNHEGFAIHGIVAASPGVKKALRSQPPPASRTARAS